MGNMDAGTAAQILLALVAVGLIILVADLVIFFRWIAYRIAASEPPQGTPFPQDFVAYPAPTPLEAQGESADEEASSFQSQPDPLTALPLYPEAPAVKPPFAPTWSVVHPFLSFQFVFLTAQLTALLLLLPVIGPVLLNPDKFQAAISSSYGIGATIAALVLQNVLFVAATHFFVRRYGSSLREIGLRKPTQRELLLGIGLGAAIFLLAGVGEQALHMVVTHLPPALAERLTKLTKAVTADALFETIHNGGLKFAFVLAGAVAAPIGEEVFFRGFLYTALKKRWGVPVGIVVSGLAFALVHVGPLAVIVIFPMGMLLAYVYERTNSLWVTILMHMMNNGVGLLLAWFLPQWFK